MVASREFSTAEPRPLGAQSSTDLFDDTTLHEVRLFVHSKDLATLRARYLENINTPADIQIDGTRVRNVAIRSRGGGSRNPDKLGLRVDFDFYTRGRRFRGLEAIVLDNFWQDEALIREQLAMKVFRQMGEVAPRESFCRLYLNNQFQGVYGLVEEIDPDFSARETGESNGYLYEYHYRFLFNGEDLGPGFDLYKMIFEARNHELEPDEQLYGPIRDLFHDMNEPDDALWFERVGQRLDLPQFMRSLAIEAFVGEGDGLLGYAGMNNFYLYRSPATQRHQIFPWDRDLSFRFDTTSLERGLDQNLIFRRAFAQPELKTIYLDTIENTARMAMENNWLETEIDRLVALIDAPNREPTPYTKHFTEAEFDTQVAFLRNLARVRPQLLIDEVARNR
ncbi:MAG TPA: CotH kinase family protein [Vicinamibacterales bacterium]|nr:CotH kinase family protein [Vicinamibacterales bacterium]